MTCVGLFSGQHDYNSDTDQYRRGQKVQNIKPLTLGPKLCFFARDVAVMSMKLKKSKAILCGAFVSITRI